MSLKSRNTAMAITLQSGRGQANYNAPSTTTDLIAISNLRPTIDGITVSNEEYTGSVFQNADALAGKRFTATFNVYMRPPPSLPAANAFVLGRLLQAAKCTEVRTATAIPAAPEALGVGSTVTEAVLGATASITDEIYKGFPLILSDNGTGYQRQMTSIRSYGGAGKVAELMEELALAPAANYQIPPFIGYFRDVTSGDPPVMSMKMWLSGYLMELYDVGITGMRWVIPTSTKDQPAFPQFEFTVEATIYATSDEATPSIPSGANIPLFKDADMWLNKIRVGTQNLTIDMGIQSDNPPNPNQPDGTDAPEIAGGTATASLQMQMYLKATLDTLGLADAQAYHPAWAQWGNSAFNMVQLVIPDARLNYPNVDLSGSTVMQNLDLFIDVLDRNLGVVFPGA